MVLITSNEILEWSNNENYNSFYVTHAPPENHYTHPMRNNQGCVFFFLQDCFGISFKYDIIKKGEKC